MVKLNKIYTRTGDQGDTGLVTGARVRKSDARVRAYGDVDETNSAVGLARLHVSHDGVLGLMLERIQNELFDLGADLATPTAKDLGFDPLRIIESQVDRLEREIDQLNAGLEPLRSFVLPAGAPAAAHLHLARTICRRAERSAVALADEDADNVSMVAIRYLNRLSDLLFVMSRHANKDADGDVLWQPGATRDD